MRKFILLLVLSIIALLGTAIFSDVQAADTPTILSFTTPVTVVDRSALQARRVRLPVSWQAANRPITANLFFEQVFPDGSHINIDMPRLFPWVLSSGEGLVAPILQPDDASEIVLRLRLLDLLTQQLYSEQQITLPIGITDDPGSDLGSVPTIRTFSTSAVTVLRRDLQDGSARLPVSWSLTDRPITANLIFEQVLAPGSVVNIELPRDNPWVSTTGSGNVAPREPFNGGSPVQLRLRLVDVVNGRIYDQRDTFVQIIDQVNTPQFRWFNAGVNSVRASELQQRAARVPVNWAVDQRPANTNLLFEQVLSNGTVVNVELPRSNPIVPSSGNGVVAPLDPGGSAAIIRLRVRLIDLANGAEYARRELTLPIASAPPAPQITTFTTGASSVSAAELQNGTARIPVNWAVTNRPANTNLQFVQLLPNGTPLSVELPRTDPIVPSSGTGVLAPTWPWEGAATITLEVRLIDLSSGRIYAQRNLSLPIVGQPLPPDLAGFSATVPNVQAAELQSSTAHIPVNWLVINRPANTNLVFEQRLPNGAQINVELPRTDPIVPSSGNGVVAPIWPGPGQNAVILVLRLIDLSSGATLDTAQFDLPIVSSDSGVQYGAACFQTPYAPGNGTGNGSVGRVLDTVGANGLSVRSSPNGDVIATLPVGETFDVIDGPACWQIQTFAPADQYEFRGWRIRNRRNNLEGWVEEYGRRNAGSPFYYYQVLTDSDTNGQQAVINAFSADPAAVEYRGTVTLSWSVSDAARVRIQVVRFNGQFGQTLDNLPLEGRFSYTLPEESTQSAQFQLSAEDAQGRQLAVETLTVPVRCGFSDTYNGCPLTQLTTQAAYQTFQGGLMLWRGDMQQIFVLYNGGTYQIYDDTWTPDQPVDSGETPPSGLILPARGFGKVWANQPGVRDRLGWASGNEASYTAKVETYLIPRDEKAIFINTPDGRVLIIGQVWRTQ